MKIKTLRVMGHRSSHIVTIHTGSARIENLYWTKNKNLLPVQRGLDFSTHEQAWVNGNELRTATRCRMACDIYTGYYNFFRKREKDF